MTIPFGQKQISRAEFIMTQFGCSEKQAENLIELITDPTLPDTCSYHARAIMAGARKVPPPKPKE